MQDDNDDVLRLIPGGGKNDAIKDAMRELKRTLSDQIELQAMIAQLQRARYEALIEEGFDENQAIELSKKIMG